MTNQYPTASLSRRLAAMFYDAFLIIAVWMATTMFVVVVITGGKAAHGLWYQLLLYAEVFLFYYVFWRIKGQTLGMQVWKIRVLDRHGMIMSRRQCLIRFLVGTVSFLALGFGFWWMLMSRSRLTWHDMASNTRVVYLGKRPYAANRPAAEASNPPQNKSESV